MKIGHTNYIKQAENYVGQVPANKVNEIADYFKEGASPVDVMSKVRVNGQKLALNTIKTIYEHINLIEKTIINILNGSSIIYTLQEVEIPENQEELLNLLLEVIDLDGDNFTNVYDTEFEDLSLQINYVLNNILEINSSFEALKNSISINENII